MFGGRIKCPWRMQQNVKRRLRNFSRKPQNKHNNNQNVWLGSCFVANYPRILSRLVHPGFMSERSGVNPPTTRVIIYLVSGMNHQVPSGLLTNPPLSSTIYPRIYIYTPNCFKHFSAGHIWLSDGICIFDVRRWFPITVTIPINHSKPILLNLFRKKNSQQTSTEPMASLCFFASDWFVSRWFSKQNWGLVSWFLCCFLTNWSGPLVATS